MCGSISSFAPVLLLAEISVRLSPLTFSFLSDLIVPTELPLAIRYRLEETESSPLMLFSAIYALVQPLTETLPHSFRSITLFETFSYTTDFSEPVILFSETSKLYTFAMQAEISDLSSRASTAIVPPEKVLLITTVSEVLIDTPVAQSEKLLLTISVPLSLSSDIPTFSPDRRQSCTVISAPPVTIPVSIPASEAGRKEHPSTVIPAPSLQRIPFLTEPVTVIPAKVSSLELSDSIPALPP